jgi:hypothetical protein
MQLFTPSIFKRQNIVLRLHHLPNRQNQGYQPGSRPGPIDSYSLDRQVVNINKKGRFNLNRPLMNLAPKMPFIISPKELLTNTPGVKWKIKQHFGSSRIDGIFYPIGHQIKLQTYFQVNWKSYIAVIPSTYPKCRGIVIFYDVTGFQKRDFLWIISMFHHLPHHSICLTKPHLFG